MEKQFIERVTSVLNRSDKVIASFTESNFPCLILAGIQPLYLITFRVELATMSEDNVFAIGRDDCCDFNVSKNLPRISRLHCYIEKCGDGSYKIHDVSKYGTYVQFDTAEPSFKEKMKNFFKAL